MEELPTSYKQRSMLTSNEHISKQFRRYDYEEHYGKLETIPVIMSYVIISAFIVIVLIIIIITNILVKFV